MLYYYSEKILIYKVGFNCVDNMNTNTQTAQNRYFYVRTFGNFNDVPYFESEDNCMEYFPKAFPGRLSDD